MRQLLTQQRVAVAVEGPLLVLTIGREQIRMEYDTALKLSTWMRVRAKQAKLNAGDHSRHWSIIGNLEAVLSGERPW